MKHKLKKNGTGLLSIILGLVIFITAFPALNSYAEGQSTTVRVGYYVCQRSR